MFICIIHFVVVADCRPRLRTENIYGIQMLSLITPKICWFIYMSIKRLDTKSPAIPSLDCDKKSQKTKGGHISM